MATRHGLRLAFSLAVLGSTVGCSTTGSFWPSGWFGSNTAQQNNLAQYSARNSTPANPSRSGANAQLGAPAAAAAGPFASMTASFKKWSGGSEEPATPEDPLSLNNVPKQMSPEFYVQIARMHEAKGDFAGAIKQYEQALKTAPTNTDVLVSLARCYDRKGDMPKAVETYQKAIKIDSRCALAYNDLGICYSRQNDISRSLEHLSKAVSLVPTSKLYRNNLAKVLVQNKQYDDAYQQLAAVNSPAVAQYNLGVLANRFGNKAEAIRRLEQAAATDPNLVQARQMIDKINGVAQQTPAVPSVSEQARQVQTQLRSQANQYQTSLQNQFQQSQNSIRDQARDMQTDWKNQAQSQYQQVKTQVGQAQTQFADQAQSQATQVESRVSEGVNNTASSAQAAIRDAEAKIRAALQPQVAPVGPNYGDAWVPPQNDDITPIEGDSPSSGSDEESTYSISDDDETPTLLPPTGE